MTALITMMPMVIMIMRTFIASPWMPPTCVVWGRGRQRSKTGSLLPPPGWGSGQPPLPNHPPGMGQMSQWSQVPRVAFLGCFLYCLVFVIVFWLVESCLLITLITFLKGQFSRILLWLHFFNLVFVSDSVSDKVTRGVLKSKKSSSLCD